MKKAFFILIIFLSQGQNLKSQVLENFNGKNELLQTKSWMGTENQLDILIDLRTYPLSRLALELPKECSSFIDGKLWFIAGSDTLVIVPVKTLSQEFGMKTVQLTLIGENLNSENISVQRILELPREISPVEEIGDVLVPKVRKNYTKEFTDFYFVSVFVLLFFIAMYKMGYPYLLGVMLQPTSIINAEDFSESGSLQKFFSYDIQLYLFIVSMMMAQVIMTAAIIFKFEFLTQLIAPEFGSLMVVWVILSFLVLVLTHIKFIAIRIMSYLFDLGKTDFAHFFYLLRMLVFTVSILSGLTAFFLVNDFNFLESNYWFFLSGMFWIYLIAILGLFLIMMSRLSFKKYHLFTYLCIAELAPFLILSKWILVLIH
jgi:hypothetical protein